MIYNFKFESNQNLETIITFLTNLRTRVVEGIHNYSVN